MCLATLIFHQVNYIFTERGDNFLVNSKYVIVICTQKLANASWLEVQRSKRENLIEIKIHIHKMPFHHLVFQRTGPMKVVHDTSPLLSVLHSLFKFRNSCPEFSCFV